MTALRHIWWLGAAAASVWLGGSVAYSSHPFGIGIPMDQTIAGVVFEAHTTEEANGQGRIAFSIRNDTGRDLAIAAPADCPLGVWVGVGEGDILELSRIVLWGPKYADMAESPPRDVLPLRAGDVYRGEILLTERVIACNPVREVDMWSMAGDLINMEVTATKEVSVSYARLSIGVYYVPNDLVYTPDTFGTGYLMAPWEVFEDAGVVTRTVMMTRTRTALDFETVLRNPLLPNPKRNGRRDATQ